jgi:hypothetical protein
MRDKTKKQQPRETFSQLKKQIEEMKKDIVVRCNAALEEKQKYHQAREKAEQLEQYYREELRRVNKYHPALAAKDTIVIQYDEISEVMQYRLLPPSVHWDDDNDVGWVELYASAKGKRYSIGYVVSGGALRQAKTSRLLAEILSKDIAQQLLDRVKKV